MIAYPERNRFRLGPAQGIPKQNFREIWVEIGETFKQNLGDSSAKLWSRPTRRGSPNRVQSWYQVAGAGKRPSRADLPRTEKLRGCLARHRNASITTRQVTELPKHNLTTAT